jgi:two-component system cell cycle sensor histidine kinase/response regulator CckA
MAMTDETTETDSARPATTHGSPAPFQGGATALFEMLFKTSPDFILATDGEGRLLFLSDAAAYALETSPERALGRTLADLTPTPSQIVALFDRCRQSVFLTGQHVTEIFQVTVEGREQHFEATFSPVLNEPMGSPVLLCIARNITEYKRQEMERQYVMASANCLLWYADVHDTGHPDYLGWNIFITDEEAAQRFLPLDLQPGEAYKDAKYRHRLPEDRAACDRMANASIRAGKSYTQEFRCQCADGTIRWLREDIQVETAIPDRLWRVVAVCVDITEHMNREIALRESEERLQAALSAGDLGVWDWDIPTNTVRWAAETERLFGLEPTGFASVQDAYRRLVPQEDQEMVRATVQRAIQNRTPFEYEHRLLFPDGSQRWLLHKGRPFYDEQGQPVRLLGAIIDMTEHRRLEQQFLQAQKMEGIGRLAGGIAHDFNNLLSVIMGYAEMVEMELAEESELLLNVRNIRSAAARAAQLTAQLLAFARKQVSEARVFHPNELIRSMSQILKPLIREDIELTLRLKEEVGSIKAAPNQIEQVIINLVVNACDAMPRGGKLVLLTDNVTLADQYLREQTPVKEGDYVLIAVSDTGVGMTPEVKSRLFEPFFTTKEVGKGTGLGLATVYGIVKQSGGYIFVYSEVGIGTTLKVYLPRVDADVTASIQTARATALMRGNETVLVVEDERLVRELTVRTLQRNGYTVLEAANGREALQVAGEFPADIPLVVTDVIMPEMGGKELTDRLQALRPTSRILYVSGYTEESTFAQDIVPEGTAFLQKPFTANGLLTKVREVLDAIPLK